MPYCAVFNCKSNSKIDKDVSWFGFPRADRENSRHKSWVHYCCRKTFVPSSYSKICSKHFTSDQYSRDPTFYAIYGYAGAKPSLKNDAVPDVPWDFRDVPAATETPRTPIITTPSPKPRSAVVKRRRLEVLQDAFDNNVCTTPTCTSENDQPEPAFSSPVTCDFNSQVNIIPSMRTRRIQVGKSSVNVQSVSIGIQCTIEEELKIPCTCKCRETDIEESVSDISYEFDSEPDLFNESRTTSNFDYSFDINMDSDVDFDPDNTYASEEDDDYEDDDEEIENYKLSCTTIPNEERFYVVSESSLWDLLNLCKTCHQETTPIIEYSRGTMISVVSTCIDGHINKWTSQAMHGKMPWFNLQLASAILTSGSNTSKALRCLNQANVQTMSTRTVSRLQALYTIPTITKVYKNQQLQILNSLKDKAHITLGGDGRCDSPGYSAKYGSYSLMDLETNKIVDLQLIQCNEVGGSTHMELEGLKRGLSALHDHGITVQDLVTDRHVMIKSYMKRQCPDINHYFDVWHITKGISKKLEAVSKRKGCETVRCWVKSIVNHCYWVAATSDNNQDLTVEKWKSVSNHIVDRHVHDSELFPKCMHGDVEDLEWMISGSRCHKLVREVVESPYLLRDIPKLSPIHQTYGLEVFHSVVNQFAPKSTHFFYSAMQARLYTAALHFNENGKRVQATRQDGTAIWCQSYPKAKKGTECVVKPKKVPPTYDYIDSIMECIVQRRYQFPSLEVARDDILTSQKATQPPSLTASFEKFDKDALISKRTSRFAVL